MSVYITIDYGSKDKDNIAEKQVFSIFFCIFIGKKAFPQALWGEIVWLQS